MRREAMGVESIPVALLLGTALAACTLALGVVCTNRVQVLSEKQRAVDSFNSFVERARISSAGGLGSMQLVELELGGGKVVVDNKLVQLVMGEEVLRSEILSLPISASESELSSGNYSIELERDGDGEYFLRMRRL